MEQSGHERREEEIARLEATVMRAQDERRQCEATAQELSQRLSLYISLADNAPNAIVMLDRAYRFTFANAQYIELHGVAREDIVGKSLEAVIGSAHYQLIKAQMDRVFQGQLVEFFTWYTYPRGNRYMHVYYFPITVNGLVEQVGVSLTDITERKVAEDALHDSEELYRAFSEATTEGIILHEHGTIIKVNNTFAEHLGYTPEEMQGHSVLEYTAPESREEILRHIGAGDPGPYIAVSIHRDGSRTIGEIRVRDILYQDRPIRVVAIRDITELSHLQEQQKLYIHTISHDLRVPVAVIHGHTQLIQDYLAQEHLDGELQTGIQAIQRSVQRVTTMIQDLVDAARLEGGQLQLNCEPVNLGAYLPELLQRNATTLDVERIRTDMAPGLPPVSADYNRLERILMNMVTNALKYSPPEQPVIIRAQEMDDVVQISVQDFGQGIAPADIPHIFERFYRAKGGRQAEGVGLGLYIVKALVEAHGGHVWVDSRLGEGSTFYFTLQKA